MGSNCSGGCYKDRVEDDASQNGELKIERIASQQELQKKAAKAIVKI